ncbi:hypothetical protein PENTCL1PPCAC_6046, partial [Pristionchus entomophagus]
MERTGSGRMVWPTLSLTGNQESRLVHLSPSVPTSIRALLSYSGALETVKSVFRTCASTLPVRWETKTAEVNQRSPHIDK